MNFITETSEPGAREDATIEGSESQILASLEVELVESTSVIWAMKADCEMKDGKI
jgi:hypothetical protein